MSEKNNAELVFLCMGLLDLDEDSDRVQARGVSNDITIPKKGAISQIHSHDIKSRRENTTNNDHNNLLVMDLKECSSIGLVHLHQRFDLLDESFV